MSKLLFTAITCFFTLYGQAQRSANLNITNNYIFRGFTISDDEPALQGGVDYNFVKGFYVGTWGSNYTLFSAREQELKKESGLEVDVFAGYSRELLKDLQLDVGYIAYFFPSKSFFDFQEVYLGLDYQFLGLKYSGELELDYHYYELNFQFELTDQWQLKTHYGRLETEGSKPIAHVSDWLLGLGLDLVWFQFEVSYADKDQFYTSSQNIFLKPEDLSDGQYILSISKTWPK